MKKQIIKRIPRAGNVLPARGVVGLEVMIIVVVLLAAVTIAIPLFLNRAAVNRENLTRQKILDIKKAMVGDPAIFQNGCRGSFGFLGDLGILPDPTTDPAILLIDLLENRGNKYPVYLPQNNVWFGWRGPYLDNTLDANGNYAALKDAWGNDITPTDIPGNAVDLSDPDNIPWPIVLRSNGPDGVISTTDDIVDVTISEEDIRTYVLGTFRDRAGNPIDEDQVTVHFPNGTAVMDSVQITTNPLNKTQYNSEFDTVSAESKRKIPIGIRYFETQTLTLEKLAALNGGPGSIVRFVGASAVLPAPFFERTFYLSDDKHPQSRGDIRPLYGNWPDPDEPLNTGYYQTTGDGERRAVFGLDSWDNYRVEINATLVAGGSGYGIFYRAQLNPTGTDILNSYAFKYDPLLYDSIQNPPVPHPPNTHGLTLAFAHWLNGAEIDWPNPPYVKEYLDPAYTAVPGLPVFPTPIFDRSHQISITVNGDEHIIKVDGNQELRFIHDSSQLVYRTNGMMGLRAWNNETVRFNHILVYPIPPVPTGEVVWWSFEEGDGPTVYGSGFLIDAPELNGTINDPTHCTRRWNAYHIHGQSIYLDGNSSGNINFGNIFNFTPTDVFSISLWVKIPTVFNPANQYMILSKRWNIGRQQGWDLKLTSENGSGFGAEFALSRRYNNNPQELRILNDLNGSGMVADEWYHIVVVYDGSGYSGSTTIDRSALRIYVTRQGSNNVFFIGLNDLIEVEASLQAGHDTTNNNNMLLGLDNNGNNGFYGDIDEVKIYLKALSNAEIEALFQKDK